MHSRHLMIEGEKMSKSKGNFYTVRQVLDGAMTDNSVDPAVLRLEMIKANYRSQMNFTRRGLEDSAANVRKLREYAASLEAEVSGDVPLPGLDDPTLERFVGGARRRPQHGGGAGGGVRVHQRRATPTRRTRWG